MWKEQQINVPVNCFTPGIAAIRKVLVPCKAVVSCFYKEKKNENKLFL